MKSFSFIISFLMLAIVCLSSHIATANEDQSHIFSVGPERDLGIVLENCNNFCNLARDRYRVCYYGIPFISVPQTVCWQDTFLRNFVANSLRILGRVRCGSCPWET